MLTKFFVRYAASRSAHYCSGQPPPQQQQRRHIAFIRTAFNAVDCERLSYVGPERLCAEWMLKNDGKVRLLDVRPPPPPRSSTCATITTTSLAPAPPAAPPTCEKPPVCAKPPPPVVKPPCPPKPKQPGDCPPASPTACQEASVCKRSCSAAAVKPPKTPQPEPGTPEHARLFFVDYNHLPEEKQPVRVQELDASGSSVTGTGFAHLRGCTRLERLVLADCKYVTNDALQWLCMVRESLHTLEIRDCPGISDRGLMRLDQLRKLRLLRLEGLTGVKDMNQCREQLQKALPDCEMDISC